MNLVQKLPIGLCLACLMMMSGCSKEDVETPEPKMESVNTHSNMKVDALPWVAPTKGFTGVNTYPNLWERYNPNSGASNQVAYPAGTSSLKHLWGNSVFPWMQSLPAIPNQPWSSFVTVTTSGKWDLKKKSLVQTKAQFLKTGSNYALTVYVASTLPKGKVAAFAKQCNISVSTPGAEPQTFTIDLTNSKNCWVKKIIMFKAKSQAMDLVFSAAPAQDGQYAYAHIFVGQDAIVKF